MVVEDLKKGINNSLKEIQENSAKEVEALKEETQNSLKELQENSIKQAKEMNKTIQNLNIEVIKKITTRFSEVNSYNIKWILILVKYENRWKINL